MESLAKHLKVVFIFINFDTSFYNLAKRLKKHFYYENNNIGRK